ncbi:hypothetical protein [Candidatus Frankia nodulisporulans]|uniref:hypothetical protein n=1 Tax=Candidatus Frankia nodulisporulans TaxID=2060052 RepID=UPI001CDC135B|nr:hypothetical protein [Candidatus Frankia nodulisporulans]
MAGRGVVDPPSAASRISSSTRTLISERDSQFGPKARAPARPSSRANSDASPKRTFGSFASARMITAEIGGGTLVSGSGMTVR